MSVKIFILPHLDNTKPRLKPLIAPQLDNKKNSSPSNCTNGLSKAVKVGLIKLETSMAAL